MDETDIFNLITQNIDKKYLNMSSLSYRKQKINLKTHILFMSKPSPRLGA